MALADGRPADALSLLEQAVALSRERTTPGHYADAQFALARALQAEGREPERVRVLAEEAAEVYRRLGPLRREPAEIAAWLRHTNDSRRTASSRGSSSGRAPR